MAGRRTFRSDNNAGLCPEALQALADASDGSHRIGYGDDEFTDDAVKAFREIFGQDAAVFFVATGSAANTLAIASLTETWQRILCHANSHLNHDESTAPERLTHCRVTTIDTATSKISPHDFHPAAGATRGDVHQPQPGVLTISNPTELGAVYTPEETKAVCEAARELGYRVHVDGARFANAVAHLGCDPRDLTVHAGVNALSFGGTKNGLAFGEAVLFFPQDDDDAFRRASAAFPFHRKGTGHLLSKHRFVAAPFRATLRGGAWLKHARHANEMAGVLSSGLARLGFDILYPTESNGVFVRFSDQVHDALHERGHEFYRFDPAALLSRLMCSFDTSPEDVDSFLADAAALRA